MTKGMGAPVYQAEGMVVIGLYGQTLIMVSILSVFTAGFGNRFISI
jgi:hypothetical protein